VIVEGFAAKDMIGKIADTAIAEEFNGGRVADGAILLIGIDIGGVRAGEFDGLGDAGFFMGGLNAVDGAEEGVFGIG